MSIYQLPALCVLITLILSGCYSDDTFTHQIAFYLDEEFTVLQKELEGYYLNYPDGTREFIIKATDNSPENLSFIGTVHSDDDFASGMIGNHKFTMEFCQSGLCYVELEMTMTIEFRQFGAVGELVDARFKGVVESKEFSYTRNLEDGRIYLLRTADQEITEN